MPAKINEGPQPLISSAPESTLMNYSALNEDDLNYILPEYRKNARRRSQEEIDQIKQYHIENFKKFKFDEEEQLKQQN
jgi:hypothetical protein